MKNDLSKFEKDLLTTLNFLNCTKYTWKNLMEWSTDKSVVERNLQEGEIMYEVTGIYVAMKENAK